MNKKISYKNSNKILHSNEKSKHNYISNNGNPFYTNLSSQEVKSIYPRVTIKI